MARISVDLKTQFPDKWAGLTIDKHTFQVRAKNPGNYLDSDLSTAIDFYKTVPITVTATNCDESTIKYLNDNFFVCHEYFADKEFVANGKTTITLKFDKAVTISGLMVYNTLDYKNAFSGIDSVQFKMTEASDWMDDEHKDLRECYIENIGFSEDYIDTEMEKMRTGAASVVSFNEITVSEIKITISGKITDRTPTIKISDIVVLGK